MISYNATISSFLNLVISLKFQIFEKYNPFERQIGVLDELDWTCPSDWQQARAGDNLLSIKRNPRGAAPNLRMDNERGVLVRGNGTSKTEIHRGRED